MHGETVEKLRSVSVAAVVLVGRQFRPAPTPEHHVPRQRLLDLLDAATESPITVVVAPAGAGKTSLLGAWCRHRADVRTAWLSLDEADRSTGQFWAATCAVLRHALDGYLDDLDGDDALEQTPRGLQPHPRCRGRRPSRQRRPGHRQLPAPGGRRLRRDVARAARSAPFPTGCTWWSAHVGCRTCPSIVCALVASSRDIRFDELQFNEAESLEVVTRLAPWLPSSEAALAAERADGWAAGLQLGGLAARAAHAQGRDTRAAGRTDLMVTDYVWNEVLAQESPDLIDVLLDVSVVERLSPALAATLADRDDAQSLLLEAETRGLFVERLGSGDLQIHGLVRKVLLAEAIRRDPDRVRERHVRAARWFGERDGDRRHRPGARALAGCGRTQVGAPAARHSRDRAVRPGVRGDDLDDPGHHPRGRGARRHRGPDRPRLVPAAGGQGPVPRGGARGGDRGRQRRPHAPATQGRVRMLQAIAATMTGEWSEGGQQALQAIQLLGAASWADPFGRFGWNMVARDFALSESWDDARTVAAGSARGTQPRPGATALLRGHRRAGARPGRPPSRRAPWCGRSVRLRAGEVDDHPPAGARAGRGGGTP